MFTGEAEGAETYWCIDTKVSGSIQSNAYLFTTEKQSMMLMTEFAKSKNMEFNPLDEEQKKNVFYTFLKFIFDAYLNVAQSVIGANIQYQFGDIKPTDINLVEEIQKKIADEETKAGKRLDVTTVRSTITLDRQPFEIILVIPY
jgi:hypothetical protein